MKKDYYYKLYEIEVINQLSYEELVEVSKTMDDFGIGGTPLTVHCFGKEFMDDLKRNEKVLKKSKV